LQSCTPVLQLGKIVQILFLPTHYDFSSLLVFQADVLFLFPQRITHLWLNFWQLLQ